MKKYVSILTLTCLMVLSLLMTSCAVIVYTTPTPTIPPSTLTSTPTPTPPPTTTPTPSPTTTPPPTVTETIVPTTTPVRSPFHGSITVYWSGGYLSGALILKIDEYGEVTGTLVGSYTGTIKGQVDLLGVFSAKGTALLGQEAIELTWQGLMTTTRNYLNVTGTWSGPGVAGSFMGTGGSLIQ